MIILMRHTISVKFLYINILVPRMRHDQIGAVKIRLRANLGIVIVGNISLFLRRR